MVAKLIAWAATREQGLDRMQRALHEFLVLGVKTSIPLHLWLLAHPAFRRGEVDTGWLERESSADELTQISAENVELAALAAALVADQHATVAGPAAAPTDGAPAGRASAWRLAARQAAVR
jgi:pyruvate carboxylase subunit A